MTAQTPLQSLNFLLHPNEVSMPSWTTSFHLFFKVYVQHSLYLLAFLVSKELTLRLQSPQGGNYLFKNILSSHYTILTESTVKWLTKHKVKKVIMSQLTLKKNPKWIYSRYSFFLFKMQRDMWISWEYYGFHKLAPGEKSIISTFRKLNKYLKSSHNNH